MTGATLHSFNRPSPGKTVQFTGIGRLVRVALFVSCIDGPLVTGSGTSTIGMLERLGCDVVLPPGQVCCGQLHLNAGDASKAQQYASALASVFTGFEAIVSTSASCVAALRELEPRFQGRLFELSEFIVGCLHKSDLNVNFNHRVVYFATCHSRRLTEVPDAPIRLLEAVHGLTLITLDRATECCGINVPPSARLLGPPSLPAEIVQQLESCGAEYCTALDGPCLMRVARALDQTGSFMRTVHLATILASTSEALDWLP